MPERDTPVSQMLRPEFVTAEEQPGGAWLVGWIFSDKQAGLEAVQRIAEKAVIPNPFRKKD